MADFDMPVAVAEEASPVSRRSYSFALPSPTHEELRVYKIRIALLTFAGTLAVFLTGCSGAREDLDTSGIPNRNPSVESMTVAQTPSPEVNRSSSAGPVLVVRIDGDRVSPNAVEIRLGSAETLTVSVVSDRAGQLHVHSKPDQYVEFTLGRSEQGLLLSAPAEVEIEDHESGAVVALLEVG